MSKFNWSVNPNIAKATMFTTYESFCEQYPEAVEQGVTYDSWQKKRKRMQDANYDESFLNVDPNTVPQRLKPVFLHEQGAKDIPYTEFLDLAPKIQKFFDDIDPITVFEPIAIPSDKPIILTMGSCLHIGGRYTFHDEFRELFHKILNAPGIYWGSLGDEIEGFFPTFFSKEAVTNQLFPRILQLQALNGILEELHIRNMLLFGTSSQHGTQWEEKLTGENQVKPKYLERGVPFFDGRGQIDLHVGDMTYHIGFAHKL